MKEQEISKIIDQLILGEVEWEDTSVQEALLRGGAPAQELRDLQRTLQSVNHHLPAQAPGNADHSNQDGSEIFPPSIEDVRATQAMIEAFEAGSSGRVVATQNPMQSRMARWGLLAAGALVGSGFVYYYQTGSQDNVIEVAQDPSGWPANNDGLLGDGDLIVSQDGNGFTSLIIPTEFPEHGILKFRIFSETNVHLITKKDLKDRIWKLGKEERSELDGLQQVQVLYEVDGIRVPIEGSFIWRR